MTSRSSTQWTSILAAILACGTAGCSHLSPPWAGRPLSEDSIRAVAGKLREQGHVTQSASIYALLDGQPARGHSLSLEHRPQGIQVAKTAPWQSSTQTTEVSAFQVKQARMTPGPVEEAVGSPQAARANQSGIELATSIYPAAQIRAAMREKRSVLTSAARNEDPFTELDLAEETLKVCPHDPRSLQSFEEALAQADPQLRCYAACILADVGATHEAWATACLAQCLRDSNPPVRSMAVLGLGAMTNLPTEVATQVNQVQNHDSDPWVRFSATVTIAVLDGASSDEKYAEMLRNAYVLCIHQ